MGEIQAGMAFGELQPMGKGKVGKHAFQHRGSMAEGLLYRLDGILIPA
jgi:hypothetical protein